MMVPLVPPIAGQFTEDEVALKDCTLRNIRSVVPLSTSVMGEHGVLPVETTSTLVPGDVITFELIGTW
jgi:hypothetical protein